MAWSGGSSGGSWHFTALHLKLEKYGLSLGRLLGREAGYDVLVGFIHWTVPLDRTAIRAEFERNNVSAVTGELRVAK